MNFSENLKYLRNSKQFTQKELAAYLGLTPNCICEWEKNRSEPSISTIKKLSELFDVSTDYLLGLEDDFGTRATSTATPMGESLNQEERKLIEQYRQLNTSGKHLIDETLKTLLTTATVAKSEQKKNKIS